MKDLTKFLDKARAIVRYYRIGPLGDVPSINGKLVEEALRRSWRILALAKSPRPASLTLG